MRRDGPMRKSADARSLSSIDRQQNPGDEARFVRSEKQRRVSHVPCASHAALQRHHGVACSALAGEVASWTNSVAGIATLSKDKFEPLKLAEDAKAGTEYSGTTKYSLTIEADFKPGEQDIDIVSCPRRWLSQPRRVAPAAASKPTWDSCRLTILPIGLQRG